MDPLQRESKKQAQREAQRQLHDYYKPYLHMTTMDLDQIESFRVMKGWLQGEVVDLGCGIGYLTHYFGAEGIDIHPAAVAKARVLYPERRFYQRNIHLEGWPKKYDVIVCYNVLEHVPAEDQGPFIKTLQSGLKRNGIVLFGYADPFHPLQLVSGLLQRRVLFDPTHHFNWSVRTFLNYLSDFFDILETKRTSPFTRFVGWGRLFKGDVLVRCRPKT